MGNLFWCLKCFTKQKLIIIRIFLNVQQGKSFYEANFSDSEAKIKYLEKVKAEQHNMAKENFQKQGRDVPLLSQELIDQGYVSAFNNKIVEMQKV